MQDQEQRDKHEKTQTVAERPIDTRAVQIQFFLYLFKQLYMTNALWMYTVHLVLFVDNCASDICRLLVHRLVYSAALISSILGSIRGISESGICIN